MTKWRRYGNPSLGAVPTKADITGIPRLAKGHAIVCSRCNTAGGTLRKEDDHYVHVDTDKCSILRLRRPRST